MRCAHTLCVLSPPLLGVLFSFGCLLLSCFSVGVILFNHSDSDFQVKVGDRVAQLILERIAIADVEEVEGELTLTSVAHAHTCSHASFQPAPIMFKRALRLARSR